MSEIAEFPLIHKIKDRQAEILIVGRLLSPETSLALPSEKKIDSRRT